jgi:ubiquinone/menaquinone biosynthesis C-methylase UbiE
LGVEGKGCNSLNWINKNLVMGAVMTAPAWLFSRLYRIAPYGGALRLWVDDLKPANEGREILELGCGPGDLSLYLAGQGWQVTGFDKSDKMLRAARKLQGVTFKQGDALTTGFAANSFDAVISASLLNVVSEPENLVAEMVRLTRKGGVISVLFPTPRFDEALANDVAKQEDLSGFEQAAIEVWAGVARKLETNQVESWMSAAGLQPVKRQKFFLGGVVSLTYRRS